MADESKRGRVWLVIVIMLFGCFTLRNGFNWAGFSYQADKGAMKQLQVDLDEAGALIDQYLKLDQPSEADLAGLLGQAAVRRQGCRFLYNRMKMPFDAPNLKPADINADEYRRLFELLEALAATGGVSTSPYGSPGQAVSGGLGDMMRLYDLVDDLEAARAAYERLKALPPADDYLGVTKGGGAYRLVKLYGRAGRPAEAEMMRDEMLALLKTEDLYSSQPATHRYLAKAWIKAGRLDKAAQYYGQLKALDSGWGTPIYRLREIAWYRAEVIEDLEPAYRRAGDRQKAEALKIEFEAIMNNPELAPFVKYHLEKRPFVN